MPGASTEPKISTLLALPQQVASDGETLLSAETNSAATTTTTPISSIRSKLPRRVKVYLLQGDDWLDNGTGFCTGEVDSESCKPCFVVRNELDSKDVILQSFLEGSIQYQRQQETLIVWTDLSGKDLALSFQENDGCADLCDFIVRVQQENLSPLISLYYVLPANTGAGVATVQNDTPREITELITGPILYPPSPPSRDKLKDTLDLITQACNSLYSRQKVLGFLVDSGYFDHLFALFHTLENAHDLDGIYLLNDIIKMCLYYNEPRMVEALVSSELRVMGLVGILEYDRDLPGLKACHREYLLEESRLKTVVDIPLPPLPNALANGLTNGLATGLANTQMDIFRTDFVLQYLKNVVLPHKMEDLALGVVGSMIQTNQEAILDLLKDSQANNNFLRRLFALYDSPLLPSLEVLEVPMSKKHDGVRLLHQYVFVAKAILSSQLADFFDALAKAGLLKMIKFALTDQDSAVRVLGMEILTTAIDQDVPLVALVSNDNKEVDEIEDGQRSLAKDDLAKDHSHDKCDSIMMDLMNDMSLTLVLGNLLLEDDNPSLKMHAFEALKSLLCTSVFDVDPLAKGDIGESPNDSDVHSDNDAYVKQYFEGFYAQVAPKIFRCFIDLATGPAGVIAETEAKLQKDPVLFQHLCDLISFCCNEHESSVCRPFFTKSRALDGIVKVLELQVNVTLKLAALRCFKSLILLDDYAFCSHMVEHNLFKPFFAYFDSVADEDSLPNSLCLDLLELIIKRSSNENFGCLVVHICNNFREFLDTRIAYVSTGRDMKVAAEKFKERMKDFTATSVDVDVDAGVDDDVGNGVGIDAETGYARDAQPSSPISQETNVLLSLPGSNLANGDRNGNGSLALQKSMVETADADDSAGKRKNDQDDYQSVAEKKSRIVEREMTSCYGETAIEDEAAPTSMAT